MTDKKLEEALKWFRTANKTDPVWLEQCLGNGARHLNTIIDAAARLNALEAENAELRDALKFEHDDVCEHHADCPTCALLAKYPEVIERLDAARRARTHDEIVRETVERCANRVEQIAALARRVGRTLEPKDLLALAADLRSVAPEQPVKE